MAGGRRAAAGRGPRARRRGAGAPAGAAPAGGAPASPLRVAVLGATGYTGAEISRLAHLHPALTVSAATSERSAGRRLSEAFPHLLFAGAGADPLLSPAAEVDWDSVDAAFCCLPHGTTQAQLAALPAHVRTVDLSADFRLRSLETYKEWYGAEHQAPGLQEEAVYGLTEPYREDIRGARLVANPGCYPTCSLLPLLPLLRGGLVRPGGIVVDAKSGVTGAGRAPKEGSLYCEVDGGLSAYGVGSHRHMPEIEQELARAVGADGAAAGDLAFSFTPHLIPMARGMMCTIYVELEGGASAGDLRACLEKEYGQERFVRVAGEGEGMPQTRHVRGTNFCHIGVVADRIPGRAILVSVIDNLVKGASGQAMQNLNLMFGLPEETAIGQLALFP